MRKFAWTRPFRNAVRVGLDCSRGMECTVQVLAAHCVLKQILDTVASPGTMLAPALSSDRELQQQYILTPDSAKDALAQHHAHHCSVCGQQGTHIQASTHICTHTYTYTYTHAHTCTHTKTTACEYSDAHTHIHMHTHKHTDTRTRTYTRLNTRTHAQTHMHIMHTCA